MIALVVSHEVHLKKRPIENENFEIVEVQIPVMVNLVRNIWMSIDPYIRGRMIERQSYIPPFELDRSLEGRCVGRVVESKNNQFAVGDYVLGVVQLIYNIELIVLLFLRTRFQSMVY